MNLSTSINEIAALIWAIADKLTGVYKPHEYGEVILPLAVIRRFDCILVDTKEAVLEKYEEVKTANKGYYRLRGIFISTKYHSLLMKLWRRYWSWKKNCLVVWRKFLVFERLRERKSYE